MHPAMRGDVDGAVGLDTPRSGVEKRIRSPARVGQKARRTPLCGVLMRRLYKEFVAPGAMTLPDGKLWNLSYN